ncbi:MAG: heme ABC exporter ATP-binding protein CcmA [Candidatus Lindowbacteria bacterium]|nr:heme ABC exporter ATP-binding protein CcmA [Candidatus Lindowbacteria bacterium]
MTPVLKLSQVTKHYGDRAVLNGVDLSINSKEIVLLKGSNGSGKTTLLRISSGLLRPDSGTVLIDGSDPGKDFSKRRLIAYMGHDLGLYYELTAQENLEFYAGLYGLEEKTAVIRSALDSVNLIGRSSEPVRNFSRGMKERLGLARLLMHDPKIFLLDEPTTGLDRESKELLMGMIKKWSSEEKAVLMATHDENIETELNARLVDLNTLLTKEMTQ